MAHPEGGTTTPPPLSRATLILTALAILIVGVLGGGVVGWLRRPDPSPTLAPTPAPASSSATGGDPSTPVPSSPSPLPSAASPSPLPSSASPSPLPSSASPSPRGPTKEQLEKQARDRLDSLADDGYATANPRGQWVAQLSSKWIGITDPALTARVSGGHKFAAIDIIAEYEATKQKAEDVGGATVVLIKGSDIKKGRDETSSHLFWYIFAVDFGSEPEAQSWCHDLYPQLSGERLKNVCYATRLKP